MNKHRGDPRTKIKGIPDGYDRGLNDTQSIMMTGTSGVLVRQIDWDPKWFVSGDFTQEFVAQRSERPWYSKSPWTLIPGTSTPWRKPTRYRRLIYKAKVVEKAEYLAERWAYSPAGLWLVHAPVNPDTIGNLMGTRFLIGSYPNMRSEERDRLEVETLLKLADGKVKMGEALAESRKTAEMLASRGYQLYRALKALRHGNFGEMASHLGLNPMDTIRRYGRINRRTPVGKGGANLWLEYQYGWKPLMGDIHGLYELFREQIERPALLLHAVRNMSDEERFSPPIWISSFGGQSLIRYYHRRKQKYRLDAVVDSSTLRTASRLGLVNPAELAWDLVPLSFVVDWGLPVGNTLAAMTATVGLDFLSGSYTSVVESSASSTCVGVDHFHGSTEKVITPGLTTIFQYAMEREALQAFPTPKLYAKNPFSTSHAISAAALARQLSF